MAKRYFSSILIACIFLIGCGGGQHQLSIVPVVHAQAPLTQNFACDGLNADTFALTGAVIWAKWDVFVDGSRWVAVGSAGQYNGETNVGVPPMTRFALPMPSLPSTSYTLDTYKLGVKQSFTTASSLFMVSTIPGFGQPTVTVRPEDNAVHIERLLYPHNGFSAPFIWVQNSWSNPQVMTFVIAGEIR